MIKMSKFRTFFESTYEQKYEHRRASSSYSINHKDVAKFSASRPRAIIMYEMVQALDSWLAATVWQPAKIQGSTLQCLHAWLLDQYLHLYDQTNVVYGEFDWVSVPMWGSREGHSINGGRWI